MLAKAYEIINIWQYKRQHPSDEPYKITHSHCYTNSLSSCNYSHSLYHLLFLKLSFFKIIKAKIIPTLYELYIQRNHHLTVKIILLF